MLMSILLDCTNCLCILLSFKRPQEVLEVLLNFVGALPADAGTKVVLAKHWILCFLWTFFTIFSWTKTFSHPAVLHLMFTVPTVGLVFLADWQSLEFRLFWGITLKATASTTNSIVFLHHRISLWVHTCFSLTELFYPLFVHLCIQFFMNSAETYLLL